MPITHMVRYAPCGDCGEVIPRDAMYSINVKCYDPSDRETKLRLRFCKACRDEFFGDLDGCEWDDSQMIEKEVEVETVSRRVQSSA